MTTWSERLAEVLQERGITQAELARAADVAAPSVNVWIRGGKGKGTTHDMRAMDMLRACEALGVRPRWLMFGENPKWAADEWPFSVGPGSLYTLSPLLLSFLDQMLRHAVSMFGKQEQNR